MLSTFKFICFSAIGLCVANMSISQILSPETSTSLPSFDSGTFTMPSLNEGTPSFPNTIEEASGNTLEGIVEELLKRNSPENVTESEILRNMESGSGLIGNQAAPKTAKEILEAHSNTNIPFDDFIRTVDPKVLNEALLNDLPSDLDGLPDMSWAQQVAGGTPIGGPPGSSFCQDQFCGNIGPMVLAGTPTQEVNGHETRICPLSLCTEEILGCPDALCGFPDPQEIPFQPGNPRLADIKYIKKGFPEVVVIRQRAKNPADSEWSDAKCTATAITSKWILTALHCIAPNKLTLKNSFVFRDSEQIGWSKLDADESSSIRYEVVSHALSKAEFVKSFYIPYSSLEEIIFDASGLTKKDLLLVELNNDGIDYKVGQLPVLDFSDYPSAGNSISFSGFGWSNNGMTNNEWKEKIGAEKWLILKQSAFNFISSIQKNGSSANKLIKWQHGNYGANGGPCRFDSGGPVYAGFNRGFWDDPRRLIGVVSYFTGAVNDANDCLDSSEYATGEMVAHYMNAICSLPDTRPRGCPEL